MTKKLSAAFLLILFITGCTLPLGSGISGPTVEPPVPPSGTVLLQDNFDKPTTGWERVTDSNGTMDYDGGVYRILVNVPNTNFWSTPAKKFTDTRIEVDVAKIGGPDSNRAGIVCRVNGPQFYFFVISNDGYFAVGRANGSQSYLLGQTAIAHSDMIKTGLALNHLRADCVGSNLAFYVNGFLVSQVIDTTLPNGEVGVTAGTFDQPTVDMVFDNFIVLQP